MEGRKELDKMPKLLMILGSAFFKDAYVVFSKEPTLSVRVCEGAKHTWRTAPFPVQVRTTTEIVDEQRDLPASLNADLQMKAHIGGTVMNLKLNFTNSMLTIPLGAGRNQRKLLFKLKVMPIVGSKFRSELMAKLTRFSDLVLGLIGSNSPGGQP